MDSFVEVYVASDITFAYLVKAQLEEAGIVGPYDGSKAREVLVDEQYLREHYKDYADEIS